MVKQHTKAHKVGPSLFTLGCEWELIPQLVENGLASQIRIIQVGWYNSGGGGVGNRAVDLCNIHATLSKTHRLVDGVPFGWERWVKLD